LYILIDKKIPKKLFILPICVHAKSRRNLIFIHMTEELTMPRIQPLALEQADANTAAALKAVQSKLGMLPNMFTTFAHAPAGLNAYLQFSQALNAGRLNARQREMIAIAVAQENSCAYCLSAHAAIGKGAGLSDSDIQQARAGKAAQVLDAVISAFALKVVRTKGAISDSEFATARAAGLDEGLMIEIISHVALNTLTNYVNRVSATEIDFPVLQLSSAA